MNFTHFFNKDEVNPPWKTGFLLAALSHIVYEKDTNIRHQRLNNIGFEELHICFQRLLALGDLEASIVRSENVLIVAFRGSEDLNEFTNVIDWLNNANISTKLFCGTVSIHAGFANLATLFLPEIITQLRQLPNINEIWLTGHSLGGAIAQAVGYCLHTIHPIKVKRVVTFGAPRIGGVLKWAAVAKASGYRVDRWVNEGDLVPRLPTTGLVNPLDPRTSQPVIWKHFGRLNYVDWTNSQVNFNDDRLFSLLGDITDLSTSDHAIVNYKHRIFDLMPTSEIFSLVGSLTKEISLRSLFQRIQQDLKLDSFVNSYRNLLEISTTSISLNMLRLLTLRYL